MMDDDVGRERRVIDLSFLLGPLLVLVGAPALFLIVLLAGNVAVVNGWIQP